MLDTRRLPLPLPIPLPPIVPPGATGDNVRPRREASKAIVTAAPPRSDKLTVVEIHRRMDARRARRTESYQKVLELCVKRVAAASSRDAMRMLYEVPEFVVGIPPYDIRRCTAHMMTQLRDAGFVVKYFHPRTLYVSWDPAELYEQGAPPAVAPVPPVSSQVVTTAATKRVTFADLGIGNRQSNGRVVLDLS